MLQPVALSVDTSPFDSPDRTFTPFRPFTIGAGKSAMIQVKARFANCDHFGPGHSSTLVALPMRHRALWATGTRSVDLPTAVRPAPGSG
jgi:hypothetical protein